MRAVGAGSGGGSAGKPASASGKQQQQQPQQQAKRASKSKSPKPSYEELLRRFEQQQQATAQHRQASATSPVAKLPASTSPGLMRERRSCSCWDSATPAFRCSLCAVDLSDVQTELKQRKLLPKPAQAEDKSASSSHSAASSSSEEPQDHDMDSALSALMRLRDFVSAAKLVLSAADPAQLDALAAADGADKASDQPVSAAESTTAVGAAAGAGAATKDAATEAVKQELARSAWLASFAAPSAAASTADAAKH